MRLRFCIFFEVGFRRSRVHQYTYFLTRIRNFYVSGPESLILITFYKSAQNRNFSAESGTHQKSKIGSKRTLILDSGALLKLGGRFWRARFDGNLPGTWILDFWTFLIETANSKTSEKFALCPPPHGRRHGPSGPFNTLKSNAWGALGTEKCHRVSPELHGA